MAGLQQDQVPGPGPPNGNTCTENPVSPLDAANGSALPLPAEHTAKVTSLKDTILSLKSQLKAAMRPPTGDRRFVSQAQLVEIIRPDSVRSELSNCESEIPGSLLDNYSKLICQDHVDSACPEGSTARRAIFATLLLIDMPGRITYFVCAGVNDSALPLILSNDADGSAAWPSDNDTGSVLQQCFQGWSSSDMRAFEDTQWSFMPPAPTIPRPSIPLYLLEEEEILPFLVTTASTRSGGYGSVRKVQISWDKWTDPASRSIQHASGSFALKTIRDSGHDVFEQELSALQKLKSTPHPHIAPLLAAFHHGRERHLLFPWADGGDLRTFWSGNPNPFAESCSAKWLIEQCIGLASGLKHLHTHRGSQPHDELVPAKTVDRISYGIHGDLKPENILVFMSGGNPGQERLVISDFGLTRFHDKHTLSRAQAQGGTMAYMAPECFPSGRLCQETDVWALGCVLLELCTWYLSGWEAVKALSSLRSSGAEENQKHSCPKGTFFEVLPSEQNKIPTTKIKSTVTQWFQMLRQGSTTSPATHDLLDFIESDMMKTTPNERATSDGVVQKLKELRRSCEADSDYSKPGSFPPKPPWHFEQFKNTQPTDIDTSHTDLSTPVDINMIKIPSNCQPDCSTIQPDFLSHPAPAMNSTILADPGGLLGEPTLPYFASTEPNPIAYPREEQLPNNIISNPRTIDFCNPNPASPHHKRKAGEGPTGNTNSVHDRKRRQLVASTIPPSLDLNSAQKDTGPCQPSSDVNANGHTNGFNGSEMGNQRLACPFYKHSPENYMFGTKEWKACAAQGWTIHRLKEHIYRRHCASPYRCQRCFAEFEQELELRVHQRADIPCQKIQEPGSYAIDEYQKDKIRKKTRGKSDADKWGEIYRIIFRLEDSAEIPCSTWEKISNNVAPAHPATHSLTAFRDYLNTRLNQEGDTRVEQDLRTCLRIIGSFEESQGSSPGTVTSEPPSLTYSTSFSGNSTREFDTSFSTFPSPDALDIRGGSDKKEAKFDEDVFESNGSKLFEGFDDFLDVGNEDWTLWDGSPEGTV